jgi:2-oxoglutarate dehydrogenase E2 component (dihydrolipoamide succinyltransferase)
MMADKGISSGSISGSGRDGRVLKQDVLSALAAGFDPNAALAKAGWTGSRETRTERMSMLRRKVAERLVGVKNDTAMLTTFNEVDMKPIMDLRKKYKNQFKEEKGVG